ncbi:hypothetical protein B0T11DRAFT_81845 [Plectosphaerella cucumerina]|uniref:Uncharacterized protein n=1 Tax=Plectosphaerella cucumerina TaxID=40658 RepID=A0A8K0X318_9PEZI|nr:hypothetical protein B0T11DRAFT_81845 [Plectosphaerella cucumerina]
MDAETPPQPIPKPSDSGFSFVSQFIASLREEADANIANAKKAIDKDVPRLRDRIEARRQVSASFLRQIKDIQRQWKRNETKIELDEVRVRQLFTNLDTLKAQDPYAKIKDMFLPRELTPAPDPGPDAGTSTSGSHATGQPEHDAPQDLNQSQLDDDAVEPRPAKRRRTDDDNQLQLTERTVDFDAVYADGQPTHFIVEHPKKTKTKQTRTWYIFECQKHSLLFNNLIGAMQHARGKGHSAGMGAESAIKELGTRVLGCDAEMAKKNNAAFNPKTSRNARPCLSEVFHPEPGKLYLGPWGTRGSKTWYAVVVLPLDNLESIGMQGTLRDTGLLNGNIPRGYKVEGHRIVGWETGYGDNGIARERRRYPLLWLQANVQFTFRDGKLQVPAQQCFSWLPATQLRPFHKSGPDGKPVEIPEAIREFFQPPVPGQAPEANMDWSNGEVGAAEIIDVDRESDMDYVDEAGQRSEEDEEVDEEEDEEEDEEDDHYDDEEEEEEEDDTDDLDGKTKVTEPGEPGDVRAGGELVGSPAGLKGPSTQPVHITGQLPGPTDMAGGMRKPRVSELHNVQSAQSTAPQVHLRQTQSPRAQPPRAQPLQAQPLQTQPLQTQPLQTQPLQVRPSQGQTPQGQTPQGQPSQGQAPQGQTPQVQHRQFPPQQIQHLQTQQSQTQSSNAQPVQSARIVKSPQSIHPSPVSRAGTLPQCPTAQTPHAVPSSSGSIPPGTPKTPANSLPSNPITINSQTRLIDLQNMAAEAGPTMTYNPRANHHHHNLPPQVMQYLRQSGQPASEALYKYYTLKSHPSHPQAPHCQAEMAQMEPVQHSQRPQHHGPAFPGPNQMVQPTSAGSLGDQAKVPPCAASGEDSKTSADGLPALQGYRH